MNSSYTFRYILLICVSLVAFLFIANAQSNNLQENIQATTELPGDGLTGIIRGHINTRDGKPAANVTVSVKGSLKAAISDDNGNFIIRKVNAGKHTILVSFVGLQNQEKEVDVTADQITDLDFELVESAKQLDEVVVDGRKNLNKTPVAIGKIAIDPKDLPQAVSIIGQGLIREQQALRLSDVIRNVNGVYVTTTRGNVQESFGARGYSLGSTNMFKNGFRINSGVLPEMTSLEKVEILKGSAAILYGQVAPGGIVNMITKQPKFNFGGEVSMRIGSYDFYKPAFDIYGPISKSIAYRVNGTYEKAGSFRDQVSSERYYVNPSLLFKLGKRTELIVEGDYLYNNFTPDFGIGSIGDTKIPNVPRSRFMGTPWQYNKVQQTTTTLTVRHQLSDNWKINASFSDQYYKRDYYAAERIQADTSGKWKRPLGKIFNTEKFYAGQVNLIGKLNTAQMEHNLLAGLDADRTVTYNKDFDVTSKIYDSINVLDIGKYTARTDIPVATAIRERLAPVNRFGIYVQDLVKISPKFNVLAGVRFAYVETKGIDSTNLTNGTKITGSSRYDHAFSPRFGLVYKPFTTTSFFVSYSNSFITNTGTNVKDNKPLEPSIVDQYELGVKNEFLNGMLSANVTVYRILNSNLAQMSPYKLDGSPNTTDATLKLLSGETTSDGVEVDLAATPLKGLNITAGYSYNYMRYTKTDTTVGSFKAGERLVNNPANTANGSVFYTFENGRLKGLKLGTTIVYIGDRVGGWNTDVTRPKANQPFVYRDRRIPVSGFTTIDVSAGYTFKKVSVLAKVSNLTNTYNYYIHENYSVNPIPPTQFSATVSYRIK